jgi:hypothetical protein
MSALPLRAAEKRTSIGALEARTLSSAIYILYFPGQADRGVRHRRRVSITDDDLACSKILVRLAEGLGVRGRRGEPSSRKRWAENSQRRRCQVALGHPNSMMSSAMRAANANTETANARESVFVGFDAGRDRTPSHGAGEGEHRHELPRWITARRF